MNEHQGTFLPATAGPALADVIDDARPVAICKQCGEPFTPRSRSGGRAQLFCSPEHRLEFHSQRGQRGPTCEGENAEPAAKQPIAQAPTSEPDPLDDPRCCVVDEQESIALGLDGKTVIIAQLGYHDEAQRVYIARCNLEPLIDALRDIADGSPWPPEPKPVRVPTSPPIARPAPAPEEEPEPERDSWRDDENRVVHDHDQIAEMDEDNPCVRFDADHVPVVAKRMIELARSVEADRQPLRLNGSGEGSDR
jgi:hypothetical protein